MAYVFFASTVERGYGNAALGDTGLSLRRERRAGLIDAVVPEFIVKVMVLREELTSLPVDIKASMLAFAEELRGFHSYFKFMLRRESELRHILAGLNMENSTIREDLSNAFANFYKESVEEAIDRYMNFNYYTINQASAKLYELANETRDFWLEKINECLVEFPDYFGVVFGENRDLSRTVYGWPVLFMTRFWDRRRMEGTSAIVEFMLDQFIAALKSPR